jgi:hypothetical protein
MKKIGSCILVTMLAASAMAEGVGAIEYLPANNGVNAGWGGGIYALKDEGVGFYGNVLTSGGGRKPMYESLSVSSFGDPVTARYKDPFVLNVGVTKKFGTNVAGFVGVGYASVRGEAQKFDPMYILGSNGTYYVKDPAGDKSGMNANVGLLLTVDKFAVTVGYNSFLNTTSLGIGIKF